MFSEKVDKFTKRVYKASLVISALLVLVLVGLFVLLSNNMNHPVQVMGKPTIALVDEDVPSTFDGQNYNFGKSFVDKVSNESSYNWQVVSRAVADNAYKNKSVDAVIYLPQSFSHDILTLQDINPSKAEVDYKVQNNQSALNNALLQNKIVSVLQDFNQNIVKMYYASVASNIAGAETNMNSTVNSQGNLLSNLNGQVYGPFQTTNQGYSTINSLAGALKGANSAWINQQNGFTNATKNMLQSNSSSLNGELAPLQSYFATQKQIAELNATASNQVITNQATSDATFFQNLLSKQFNGDFAFYNNQYNKQYTDGQTFFNTQLTNQFNSDFTFYGNQFNNQYSSDVAFYHAQRLAQSSSDFNFYQKQVNKQSSDDLSNYKSQYDALYKAINASLTSGSSTTIGPLADLNSKIASYNTLISRISQKLSDQKKKVTAQENTLLGLETNLYNQFFATHADSSSTPPKFVVPSYDASGMLIPPTSGQTLYNDATYISNTQTQANAKKALAEMVKSSFAIKDNLSSSAYMTKLQSLLQATDWNASDYATLFTALQRNKSLSSSQITTYQQELDLIHRYGKALGATGGSVNFSALPTGSPNNTVSGSLKITVPAGTTYNLTLPTNSGFALGTVTGGASQSGNTLTLNNPTPATTTTTVTTPPSGTTPSSSGTTPSSGTTSTSGSTASNTTTTITTTPAGPGSGKSFTIAYSIDLSAATGSTTLDFAWSNPADPTDSHESQTLVGFIPDKPLNDYVGSNFGYISPTLSQIDSLAQLITLLYGAPGADFTSLSSASSLTAFENTDKNSMYARYGNLMGDSSDILAKIEANLSDADVQSFMSAGQANIQNVSDTLTGLVDDYNVLETQSQALSNNLPSTYFSDQVTALNKWFTDTMTSITTQYNTWTANPENNVTQNTLDSSDNPKSSFTQNTKSTESSSESPLQSNSQESGSNAVTQIPITPWQNYDSSKTAIYQDTVDGDNLYQTISGLVASSSKSANDTATSAQAIQDNSAEFDAMTLAVTNTQNSAQKVIDNTNSLLNTGNGDLKTNQDYASNFASVLANTRTPGANTNNIFEFFAKPIYAKDITPSFVGVVGKTFDWRWIIIFVLGLVFGILTMLLTRWKKYIGVHTKN